MADEGIVVFRITAMLSLTMVEHSSNCTPSILKQYLIAMICSMAILEATSSEPYANVSTVFCLLDTHKIGVLLRRRMMPVTDLLVSWSLPWSASTKHVRVHC